jgi:preprotein translocase subunit SecG
VSYRTLDAGHIIDTLRLLEQRISERLPNSSLASVCRDLVAIAGETQQRTQTIAKPNLALRAAILVAVAAGVAGLVLVAHTVNVQMGNAEIFSIFQGVESAMNIVVLVGAALFFLISLETRLKRSRSLRDLHTFRSIAHVIDMHQLTKDPSFVIAGADTTASSPKRAMTIFELTRYLDYCSEMLSLTNKLAALYAQDLPDAVVIDAVNDIEQLTTNLSSKIWQKITILDAARASR